ncbi:hypothetical protein D9757_000202 [Collybiopsis confluens]|uniref:Uncharacterized protein n=1 Tax=Collybiopsis confluens TaxID=2823264 RepID=A0A8H5I3F5_9AGAR|nr:hypothetical protein D9757_000202 [Collybiopsis confluens]
MHRAARLQNPVCHRQFSSATFLSFSNGLTENNAPISPAHATLRNLLATTEASPNRIWISYTTAINLAGVDELDLQTHQSVLRRCAPTLNQVRWSHQKRYLSVAKPVPGHVHETRFQGVIRNILSMGFRPSREDYHFILAQFAAAGHSIGSINVYEEMLKSTRFQPDSVTVALVLQSIAHRLVLPERKADRGETLNHARRLLKRLLDDMQRVEMPWTSTNMDLTVRIMKHTSDLEGFETLLRLGYGIDLQFPDRLALGSQPNTLLPFNLHTLNTVIDMYGRNGSTSKLVTAFEVLTVPLPDAQKHFATSFEDEDDFGVTPSDSIASFKYPSAEPNTTTFTFLLRHISHHKKMTHLVRHYLLQAIKLDVQASRALRAKLVVTPNILDVPAPRMSVSRAMFVSVFGASNRNKKATLMRWLFERLPAVIRRKKSDVLHISNFIRHLQKVGRWPQAQKPRTSSGFKPRVFVPRSDQDIVEVNGIGEHPADADSALAVNSFHQQTHPVYIPKPIDLKLHLRILKRDIADLTAFYTYARVGLARTIERTKDIIGRRVWKGKDVYIRSGADGKPKVGYPKMRTQVSKEMWRQTVNYKPKLKTRFARPPSHFFHKTVRQQFWQETKSIKERPLEGKTVSPEAITSFVQTGRPQKPT